MRNTLMTIGLMLFVLLVAGQEEKINEFMAMYDSGEYQKLINQMDKMVFDPGSYQLYKLKGDCHHKVEDFERAVENYSLAETFSKDHSELYVHRGAAYMGIGDYDSAIKDLNNAIKVDDDNAEAYYYRGLWNFDYFKIKQAVKDFNAAIQKKKDYYEAHFMRAACYSEMKKWDNALSDYQIVQRINPEIEEATYYTAMIFFDLENFESAITEFDKIEEEYKLNPEFYFFRAEAKYFSKDRSGACSDYQAAAELGDSDSINVYQNWCIDNKEKGRFKKIRESKVRL